MVRKHVRIADVFHDCSWVGVAGHGHDLVHPRVMDRRTGDEACPQGVGGELGRVQPNGRGIPFHQARNIGVVEGVACESSAPSQRLKEGAGVRAMGADPAVQDGDWANPFPGGHDHLLAFPRLVCLRAMDMQYDAGGPPVCRNPLNIPYR